MPARAIASATVSFGMVSIPVKLFSATESGSSISFNLLHKDCGSRLKQQYICQKEEKVVPREERVKGYEFSRDHYVVFTPEELKELEEKASHMIEITEFVPASQVGSVYFDRAYYLGPDKGGDKAYRLLGKAMEESGRVALAKYGARGKQYLVMLMPNAEGRLLMQQLRYADEVRTAKDIPVGNGEVRDSELKLAIQLIDQIASEEFRPAAYEDEVKKRILEAIQNKVDGQEISISETEEPKAQVIDLMEALKASLAKKGDKASAERKPPRRSPRPQRKAKTKSAGK